MGDHSCFQTVATMSLKLQPEDLCIGKKVLSTANIITDPPCLTLKLCSEGLAQV